MNSNPERKRAIELDDAAPEANNLMLNGSPMEDEDADAEHSVAPEAPTGNGVDGSRPSRGERHKRGRRWHVKRGG